MTLINVIKLILLFLFLFSCISENKNLNLSKDIKTLSSENLKSNKKDVFKNEIVLDTFLKTKDSNYFLNLSNSSYSDSIISFCNCQKDIKNNIIKIQIKSGIPTKSELNNFKSSDKKGNRIFQLLGLNRFKRVKGQFKFLTFTLKDKNALNIELYSKSTEKDYNDSDFDSMLIKKYKLTISTFDYTIASNIIGEFDLRLPKEFGYFKNDTILSGSFNCNNSLIKTKEYLKNWNIEEWNEKRNSNVGFKIKK